MHDCTQMRGMKCLDLILIQFGSYQYINNKPVFIYDCYARYLHRPCQFISTDIESNG